MLAGKLYLLDLYNDSVHVLDPVLERHLWTLPIDWEHGITISGGLAALLGLAVRPDQRLAAAALVEVERERF